MYLREVEQPQLSAWFGSQEVEAEKEIGSE